MGAAAAAFGSCRSERSGSRTGAIPVAAQQPQTRPQSAQIDIRRILRPRHAGCSERGAQPCRWHPKERTQDPQPRSLDQSSHAGQSPLAAAANRAHQHRLGLITRMVPEQQMQNAASGAGLGQSTEPCRPRAFRQGRSPGDALDGQRPSRNAPRRKSPRRLGRLRFDSVRRP